MTTLRHRSIAVLTLSSNLTVYERDCGGVVNCMLALASPGQAFESLAPLLATAKSNLTDLGLKALAASGVTRSKLTIAVRNTAWDTSRLDMENLVHGVQTLSDANPKVSGELITKAGMRIWIANRPAKLPFSVKWGATSGTAIARVKSPGPTRTVHIQGSADSGKTWTIDVIGPELVHPIDALTPGVNYWFRLRVKLPNVPFTDWSDPVTLVVK